MGKRREPPPEQGAPVWMATYADLMSLLLCFFVMLFAMSIITDIKWEAFVETQQRKMGYLGPGKTPTRDNKPSTALSTTSELSRRTAALAGGQPTPSREGESPTQQTIRLDGDLVKGGLIRFELGSDELTKKAKNDLETMFPVLFTAVNRIQIKGYAAPTETEEGIYNRDFDLAYARAVAVRNYLVFLGLKEEFFQISVADSTTIPNRAILPRGTDPKLAGASAGVFLLKNTPRPLVKPLPEQSTTDLPKP